MTSNKEYWLLFEKSDETRIANGMDGYLDETGEIYRYDNLVPNYRNLSIEDVVVIRKEDEILGLAKVESIAYVDAVKQHRRCPKCKSTDIRERKTLSPAWKCGKCTHEFAEPVNSNMDVRAYTATLSDFTLFIKSPSFQEVKACAIAEKGQSSQLSILQLDADKIKTLLKGLKSVPVAPRFDVGAAKQELNLSLEERMAVDQRAMFVARKLYADAGWTVTDTSASQFFDLLATKDELTRYINVKGATSIGQAIILTHGEVTHVNNHPKESALVVVAKIRLSKHNDRSVAQGGAVYVCRDPWIISESSLEPTEFKYMPEPKA